MIINGSTLSAGNYLTSYRSHEEPEGRVSQSSLWRPQGFWHTYSNNVNQIININTFFTIVCFIGNRSTKQARWNLIRLIRSVSTSKRSEITCLSRLCKSKNRKPAENRMCVHLSRQQSQRLRACGGQVCEMLQYTTCLLWNHRRAHKLPSLWDSEYSNGAFSRTKLLFHKQYDTWAPQLSLTGTTIGWVQQSWNN